MRTRVRLGLLLLVPVLLAGCATDRLRRESARAFDQGAYEEAITTLELALREDPSNLELRLDLRTRREAAVRQLVLAGDRARAGGDGEDAARSYRRVLTLEPGNDRALHGLQILQADRVRDERIARAAQLFEQKQLDAAEAELQAVLSDDRGNAAASALLSKVQLARGPAAAVPHLKSRDDSPVSLQFRDAPTKMVFEALARQTGINFIFDKDVKSDGKTTIFVSQVPVAQAIDLILAQNQLGVQVLSDNIALVYPDTPAKQKDYRDEIVHTFYLTNAAPKDAETLLKTVLGAKTLFVDERSSTLVMRDTPAHVRMAEKLLTSLDVPEAEVIMEVEVLEITHSDAEQLGINYPSNVSLSLSKPPDSNNNTTGGGLVISDLAKQNKNTITVSSLGVSVDLLKTLGVTNVLSSPRIRARNKEKAKILVGNRLPVVTSGTSATVGGAFSTSNVTYIEVGLTLEVQPTIHSDGNVAIKVSLEVSSILKEVTVPIGNGATTLAYEVGTRNASTLLELKDGETQVLAGLIQDSDQRNSTQIPGLGDLPIIGRLFGSTGTTKDKNEIVLSITPRVIRAQSRPSLDTTEFWYGTESQARSAPFASGAPAGALPPAAGAMAAASGGSFAASAADNVPVAPPPTGPRAVPARLDAAAGPPAAPPATPSPAPGATSAPGATPAAGATPAPGAVPGGAADGKAPAGSKPADAAAADATAAAPAPAEDPRPRVAIEGPESARVGEEINVAVRLASTAALGRIRTQVGFDASALQLVSAEPGDLAPAGDQPKVELKPGGVQLELAGGEGAPVSGGGTLMRLRFRAVASRPSTAVATQVVLVGEDGIAVAATQATPLKIAVAK